MSFDQAQARYNSFTPDQRRGVRIRLALSKITDEAAAMARAVSDEMNRKPFSL